jgi:hypothetical protein
MVLRLVASVWCTDDVPLRTEQAPKAEENVKAVLEIRYIGLSYVTTSRASKVEQRT